MFSRENFAFLILLISGSREKLELVPKSALSKLVLLKIAPLNSHLGKPALDRSASEKSTCSSLQLLNFVPLSFSLKNEEKFRRQSSKLNDNRKVEHSSNRTPSNLQFLKLTSLKEVPLTAVLLKSQSINSHSEKDLPERLPEAKLQPVKVQFSYSPSGSALEEKFSA